MTRVVLLPVRLENVSAIAGSEHQEVHPLPRQRLAFRPLVPLMLRQGVVMEIDLWQQSRTVAEASLHRVIPVGVEQQLLRGVECSLSRFRSACSLRCSDVP